MVEYPVGVTFNVDTSGALSMIPLIIPNPVKPTTTIMSTIAYNTNFKAVINIEVTRLFFLEARLRRLSATSLYPKFIKKPLF